MFLLDDKRISEINMISGRTRKRTPKLHPLLNSVVKMTSSSSGEEGFCSSVRTTNHLIPVLRVGCSLLVFLSGSWLCGLLASGELFLWSRDRDVLKTAAAVPDVTRMIATIQGARGQVKGFLTFQMIQQVFLCSPFLLRP